MINFRSVLILSLLFSVTLVSAEPYAPKLDEGRVSHNYLKFRVKRAEVPDEKEVPVPVYDGARVVSIITLKSSGNGMFQETKVISLASSDSKSNVVEFYKNKLSDWKVHDLKRSTLLLESGDQMFWAGGKKLLEGSRIQIYSLEDMENVIEPLNEPLNEDFPEMKSLIKVYYEDSLTEELKVDIDKVYSVCVKKEIDSKKKLMKGSAGNKDATNYIKNMAKKSCENIRKACKKDSSSSRCQGYARKYQ